MTLKPNDRIVFGTGSVFLFKHDAREKDATRADTLENAITYETALREMDEATNKVSNSLQAKVRLALEAKFKKAQDELTSAEAKVGDVKGVLPAAIIDL